MNDAEGIRNLVGTGLVQLVGSVVTAVLALGVPALSQLAADAGHARRAGRVRRRDGDAFKTLRPLFRERGKINAEVTGRLNQTLGGIRIVKTYTAEKREELVFTKGATGCSATSRKSITGVSATTAFSSVVIGIIGVIMIIVGGRAIVAGT